MACMLAALSETLKPLYTPQLLEAKPTTSVHLPAASVQLSARRRVAAAAGSRCGAAALSLAASAVSAGSRFHSSAQSSSQLHFL